MTAVYGVDLGIRKAHFFGITPLGGVNAQHVEVDRMQSRGRELQSLFRKVRETIEYDPSATFFIEEPVLAGSRNVRIMMQIAQVAGVMASAVRSPIYFVPVSTWKMNTVGQGNAKKSEVRSWLSDHHQSYSLICERAHSSTQDYADAACIAIYGSQVLGLHI